MAARREMERLPRLGSMAPGSEFSAASPPTLDELDELLRRLDLESDYLRALRRAKAPLDSETSRLYARTVDQGISVLTLRENLKPGSFLPGTRRYRVMDLIGQGGVGRVYRVRNEKQGTIHVAKILSTHRFEWSPTLAARYKREIQIQRRISHPSLIRIDDVIVRGDVLTPIMEFAERGSLYSILRESSKPLPLSLVIQWMTEMVEGVAALHAKGVVHRDLTPKNVLVRGDNSIAVADFGIARELSDITITGPREPLGSLLYISSQQRADPHGALPADDVYALGQIFFELVTGVIPHGNVDGPASIRRECPEALNHLIQSMRKHDRSQRPADGAELLVLLTDLPRC